MLEGAKLPRNTLNLLHYLIFLGNWLYY
uniref:Uncharacterized protein n=1 Tax=Arundo donax TaxID=35708 RepID=A0A0A9AEG7_ARUDO